MLWTLISPDNIPLKSGQYTINRGDASLINEISILGDFAIWADEPLSLRILADPARPKEYNEPWLSG